MKMWLLQAGTAVSRAPSILLQSFTNGGWEERGVVVCGHRKVGSGFLGCGSEGAETGSYQLWVGVWHHLAEGSRWFSFLVFVKMGTWVPHIAGKTFH